MKFKHFAKMILPITLFAVVLALLATFALPAAQSAKAAPASGSGGTAHVRVVHASPGAGTVDVFVNGAPALKGFTFGTVTPYLSLPAGNYRIQVAPAGKGIGGSVIDTTVWVKDGIYYTVAALGTASSGFSLKAFIDDPFVYDGYATVRVYHLSPNAGPVRVSVGGVTVISRLTYKNGSYYLTVPAGTYTFKVTALNAGVSVDVKATLKPGTVNSVFAVGLFGGNPSLRFVAASVKGIEY